eukprot:CAMPEP_0197072850 /NCGR_PEP_ID=MMETSP1384-20130603/210304_1 /TAXON_ID=29189 /ORGANISM="Ammonia sp." /LENGTH=476 /DNA_ID=CAMNT_0042511671 /DNA_START=57 /DNA_END=1487 /DNA_ORIENTATION=+
MNLMAGAGAATTTRPQSNQFDELKTIVTTTLDKKGILAKTQAELRKHVFEVLCGTEQETAKTTENTAPSINTSDINDKFALALIHDFLSYHQLDYTLSLMNTESQKKLDCVQPMTRNEIATRLGLGAQKPTPDSSLLHQLVHKLFDNDVFRPRNSSLTEETKLRPRTPPSVAVHSNDKNASVVDVDDIAEIDISDITEIAAAEINAHPLLMPITQKTSRFVHEAATLDTTEDEEHEQPQGDDETAENRASEAGAAGMTAVEEAKEREEEMYQKQKMQEEQEMNDALKELLDSSSFNEGELENMQQELQRIKQMNTTTTTQVTQPPKQQTLQPQRVSHEAASPSVTEYDDDDEFESEELDALNIDDEHIEEEEVVEQQDNIENNANETNTNGGDEQQDAETEIDIEEDIEEEEDIDEEIDEEIEIDGDSQIDGVSNDQYTNTTYSLKEEDELANDEQLENIADIILNVQNEKIDFQL